MSYSNKLKDDDKPHTQKEYDRVMALPEWLRKELTYLAFMHTDKYDVAFHHNIAVSGERILAHMKETPNDPTK